MRLVYLLRYGGQVQLQVDQPGSSGNTRRLNFLDSHLAVGHELCYLLTWSIWIAYTILLKVSLNLSCKLAVTPSGNNSVLSAQRAEL